MRMSKKRARVMTPDHFRKQRRLDFDERPSSLEQRMDAIKTLESWSASFESFLPGFDETAWYVQYRLPIADRVVRIDPDPEVVLQCAKAVIQSTAHLMHTNNQVRFVEDGRIMGIIDETDLFMSEVIVFLSEEYYRWFFGRMSIASPEGAQNSLDNLGISYPSGVSLTEKRLILPVEDDGESWNIKLWTVGDLQGIDACFSCNAPDPTLRDAEDED